MNFEKAPGSEKIEKLPDNFNEVLKDMRGKKEELKKLFNRIEYDLKDMANGEDPDGVREQYYPGWTDDDFKKLLSELDKNPE